MSPHRGKHRHSKHRSSGRHGSSTSERGNKTQDSFQMWFCHMCGDGPMDIEIVLACPQGDCAHWRCEACPTEYHKISINTYHGSLRPSTSAKPDISLRSAAPESKDQPVAVESNQVTRPPLEQKASGSQQWAHTLPPHGGDNVKTGSNFSATRGIDREPQSPIDNGNERPPVWREVELPLRERIRQQDNEIRGPLVVPTVSNTEHRAGFRMEETQGDDENDYLAEASDKLEEGLSSEPLPEEERAAMASVEKQVTADLAKMISGKASTLASTQVKQDLKDEPFPTSSSEGESGEREGYERPGSKTYTERQVEPASFPEGESYENEGRSPAPADISYETFPLRQVAFQAEESPLDLSSFKRPSLHHDRSPESVLEVLAPTFSISDHVSGFDSKDEHLASSRPLLTALDSIDVEMDCGVVKAQSGLPLASQYHLSRSPSVESLQSLVDSIFSTASTSSASTAPGTDNAFQRVLVLLTSDHILKGLYDQLAAKTSAGKFDRNFGTLLKRFALELEQEANCWDEQRAAQFIRSRARMMAQKIADSVYPSGHKSWKAQSSTIEQDSDLEEEPDEFAGLEKFITNSNAFQKLRENIREFLGLEPSSIDSRFEVGVCTLLKELPFTGEDQDDTSNEPTFYEKCPSSDVLNGWLQPSFSQKIRDLLLPEPTIPAGLSRVRWKCPCGETLYDDYQELKPGAAKRMEDYLRRSSYKKCAGDSGYLTQRMSKAGSSLKGFITSISKRGQTMKSGEPRELVSTELRYYSDTRTTRTPAHKSGEVFYLLLCHNSGIGAEVVKLRQPDICDINNDHKFFSFLHEEYITLRKRWWTWISLWTLQSIKFVRFELYENELVDVKKLDEVPPPTKDNEYRHGPPNPPELIPPLGPNLLMHLFKHPELAGTRRHCLKKVPRKLRSRLAVIDEEDDAIGWGLQFIEGWSKKRLMYMTALTFGVGSFVVIVSVSMLGHNIQNAAAIGSFMLNFVTIGIATAQAALHMT